MKAMFSIGAYKEALNAAIELDPKNVHARAERVGYLMNAPGIAGGDLDEAEKEATKLEELNWLVAKRFQVGIKAKREDMPGALSVASEIFERHPDDSDTRSSLGYAYQTNKLWTEADEQFAALASSEDQEVALPALYQRGRTRILGVYELEQAVEFFDAYIDGRKDSPDAGVGSAAAYWRRGMALEMLDKKAEAKASYQSALELDPDNKEAKQALKKLK